MQKICKRKRSVFSKVNISANLWRIFTKNFLVKGLAKLFKKHQNHFPVFSTVWRIFAKKQKNTPFFARKSSKNQHIDFFENCYNEPLGPQLWFTFYAKSTPIDSFRMKIRKNQKWVIFWPIFAFFEVFAHFCPHVLNIFSGSKFLMKLEVHRLP